MIGFIEDLWKSIFTPGTTPTLVLATHITFALLVITLSIFVFLSRSIHLINLLVLSILLWGTLTWFINEIDKQKDSLKSNESLADESKQEETKAKSTSSSSTASSTSTKSTTRKSRKI